MKASCDAQALSLMPDDIPLRRDVYPVVVVGDGNCLPRVGSILAFGSEERHAEIRKRIAIELKNHEATYLSDEHLTSGSNKKLTKSMMAHFSEEYCGRPMAPDEVQRIYRAEIESITKPASYMGLWQMFALSSVLNRCIYSVYPNLGNPNVRNDMNRLILPRQGANLQKPPAFIM